MNLHTTAAFFVTATVLFAAACAEERPAVSDSPRAVQGGGVDRDGAPTTADPDASISNPSLCKDVTLGGEPVVERERVGQAPEPLGGEVLPGTYDLAELTSYIPSNPDCTAPGEPPPEGGEPDGDCPNLRRTDRVAQVTLVVTEYAIQRIEATGTGAVGAPTTSAVVYETDDKFLATTALCPEGGAKDRTAYSASGAALTLVVDGREELFVRRP